jgi:ParB/RepB/Spo0J family partition protein
MTELESVQKVFSTSPFNIKVNKDLPRFREEMGDVDELALSLVQKGQLQPIVVNNDMELIAGGRRLAACLKAQIDVLCIFNDAVDSLTMRELEIEENIQRKQFTPAEEFKAIAELHNLKQQRFGEATSGRKGGHTLQDTANLLGKSKAKVIEALSLAEAVEKFPELKNCKKASEIKKAVKAIESVATRAAKSESYKQELATLTENSAQPYEIFQMSAQEFYEKLEPESVDILLTDPPYGIEIDKIATSTGGITGGTNSAGFKFDDSTERALALYRELAERSIVFTKPSSHAFIFCGPEFFWTVREMFKSVGWLCYVKPIIWIKREVGQCNVPHAWPASCYETLLYARRVDSTLVRQGQPDWIECQPITAGAKRHPTEKPIALLRNLLQRVALPGSLVVDPFMGSGSTIEAACIEQCFVKGCDILEESYNVTLERLLEWSRNQQLINAMC